MNFELRELDYFVAVAEELHFARAAERVGIEQSPLSKAIALMEKRMGVTLFVRDRRSTRLTTTGEAFLADAKRILDEAQKARGNLITVAAGRKGRLRIALSEGTAQPRTAKLLAQVREEDPQLELTVDRLSSDAVFYGLCTETLDIGLIARDTKRFSLSLGELSLVALWNDPLVVAMRPDHPLARQAAIQSLKSDIAPLTSVIELGEDGALIRPLYENNVFKPFRPFIDDVDLLLTLVAAGYGIGTISAVHAQMSKRSDVIFRPVILDEGITTFIVRRKDDKGSIAVTRFIERARRMAETVK